MSVKNKAIDRDRKGRICRKYTKNQTNHIHWLGTPGWWVTLYMNRPKRRVNKKLCNAVKNGLVDPDEVVFPLGNHRPHEYYW